MLRRLGGCAIALALLLPTQATASPASSADERPGAAATKSRTVKLGHDPVRARGHDRVRLTFHGRKGQLVNLARWSHRETCGSRTLRVGSRVGSKPVKPWATGYWKLPRTAIYTAISKPCSRAPQAVVRLQLRRAERLAAAVPGVITTAADRSTLTYLVPVHVGADEQVGLESSTPDVQVIGPDRRTTVTAGGSVLREAGRHWVVLDPKSSLTTTLTVRRSAQVDGATIALPRMGTARTTHEVAFTANAGQWVYAELLDATGQVATDTTRAIRVIGPDGNEVLSVALNSCHAVNANRGCTVRGPWLLPTTGRFVMTISADTPVAEQATTLRIRAAAVAPDLAIDGPAVTYAATSPGQWVIGRYAWSHTTYVGGVGRTGTYLAASHVAPSLGSWVVTALPHLPWSYDCGYDKACDYNRTELTPTAPGNVTPASVWDDEHQPWAVLVVPPGAQGSMELTLTKPAQS